MTDAEGAGDQPSRLEARLLRLTAIDEWRLADKSLLVSLLVSGLVLFAIALLRYAQAHPADIPFVDLDVLSLQLRLSYGVLMLWGLLAVGSVALRESYGQLAFFRYFPVQLFCISNSLFAYLMGALTTPFGVIVLLGGILAALPLFGTRSTWLGVASWGTSIVGLSALEQAGVVPYGPLFTALPVVNGQLSPHFLVGLGSITVFGVMLCALLSVTAIHQLQRRGRDLLRSREELLHSIERLNRSHEAIELANDELEARVRDRTTDLRIANRTLQEEVTQRQRAGDELNTLRLAMEAAIEGVAFVDPDGRFVEVNAAFAAMHHAEPDRMIGTVADEWVDARERWKVVAAVGGLERGRKRELTATGLRSDASSFSLEMTMVGGAQDADGSHYRFARDVTQERAAANQLNHTTKMEAIGRLVGGIAHDFNNLLTAILSASEQLEARFQGSSENRDMYELANTTRMAGTRAAELTRQLLDFAHLKPDRGDRIDVSRSIRNSIHLLESALDASIRVETDFCDEDLHTRGEAARFDSGLLNLGLNARDAMPEGGELSISTRKVRVSPRELGINETDHEQVAFALIEIADTGVGIDAANLSKVVEPFFTTKPPGKGTGLGLSVFDRYLNEVGGALRIDSAPGRGTTCSVYMPVVGDGGTVERDEPRARALEGRGVLLIAEDEPAVLKVLTMMLEKAGYSVIACADGGEAAAAFKADHARISAALLDFRMPVMNGAEVFVAFQEVAPDVPVILMSGNLSDADVDGLKSRGLRAVVAKPYTRDGLLSTIRDVIDAGEGSPS